MANYDRYEWLARRVESAIDPRRPIVDPHHHLWDRNGSTYLAAELMADTGASHHVTHTVYVECGSAYDEGAPVHLAPVGETRFVAEQAQAVAAAGGAALAAIVSHADLMRGDAIEEVLRAHLDAGVGLFRGVRHGTNWSASSEVKNGHHEPQPQQLASPAFRAGLATLARMDLTFDAWLYFDQLAELAAAARAVPECTIIVDHLGGPLGIGPHATARNEMLDVWRRGIADVASCSNVVLKVGGLGMEHYFGTAWAQLDQPPASDEVAAYWHDEVCFAIDTFGPSRCMFESNFPVDRQTMPYTVLWNAFQILADGYTATEQDQLFSQTATDTYRL